MKRVFSRDAKLGERAASLLVSTAIKAKTALTKLGAGISKLNCKKKPKKTKNIKIATLVKGATAAGIMKTIRDLKVAQEQLQENKRHNRAMEVKVGKGLYLKPYSKGAGLYLKPFSKNVI